MSATRRQVTVTLGAALAAGVVYSGWDALLGILGQPVSAALDSRVDITLDWIVPLVSAALLARVARRRTGAERWSWALMAVGLLAWSIGSSIWAVSTFTGEPLAQPGPADVFYLAMSVAWVAALVVRGASQRLNDTALGILDSLLVASATLLLLGIALVQLTAMSSSPPQTAVNLAYPVGDVIILAMLARAVARRQGDRTTLPLLLAGMAWVTAGDLLYLVLNSWGLYDGAPAAFDAPWTIGFVIIGGAAWTARHQPPPQESGGPERGGPSRLRRGTVPIVMAAAATVVGVVDVSVRQNGAPWVVTVVVVVVGLLLTRQSLTVARNRRLSVDLADTVDRLRHQASHDRLTGLPNRSSLTTRLDEAIAAADPDTWSAVLFVDIDHLKPVNDSLGHDRGDRLIRAVAERLQARWGEAVTRFGGDEFVVVIDRRTRSVDVQRVATQLVEDLNRPVDLEGPSLRPSVSVGVAIVDHGATAGELLRRADTALYRAKAEGRRRAVVYDARMDAASRRRVELEPELRRALDQDEFEVHYQPVVELDSGRLAGAEALLRWRHPTDGLLTPDRFLDDADDMGLLTLIGDRTLRDATRRFAEVNARPGQPPVRVAVNLSASELCSDDAVDRVAAALADSGLAAGLLVLEIREDVVVDDSVRRTIDGLCNLGVGIAIDDFGTGNSSLRQLGSYPASLLKIDRSFIDGLGTEDEDTFIVRAIINLARNLGMTTVAEGVETLQQMLLLRDLGCELAQGWFYDRALPFHRFDRTHLAGSSKPRSRPVMSTTGPALRRPGP